MNDPLGHQLFAQRLQATESILEKPCSISLPSNFELSHFVITGVGSSEAHARYLVYLINKYTTGQATFRSLTSFYTDKTEKQSTHNLIVFSQGISNNAQIALNQQQHFAKTLLFTSSTEAGLSKAGKEDRIPFLKKADGVITFPEEEEYEILIRLLGPLAGYHACIQLIDTLWPKSLPPFSPESIFAARGKTTELPFQPEQFRTGCTLVGNSELISYGQNLSYKFLEGLFLPAAPRWDYLSFSHGPFQQLCQSPQPVFILRDNNSQEKDLSQRTQKMLNTANIPHIEIVSTLPAPYAIFDFEKAINTFLSTILPAWQINQRNWPGKDKDGLLYQLQGD